MTDDSRQAPRRRGRPRGPTLQGVETRQRLYETAVGLIAARGWHETTLRDVAAEAGVSVGLLYRYFPSKRAVVLALYDDLSVTFAQRAAGPVPGPWRTRFVSALRMSLDVLGPHRDVLGALLGVLVGDAHDGIFADATSFSRRRVQDVFVTAVVGASDAPRGDAAPALGRLLDLAHLGVLLLWLLDKSPSQRATAGLVGLLEQALPVVALGLRATGVAGLLIRLDGLVAAALTGESTTTPTASGVPETDKQ